MGGSSRSADRRRTSARVWHLAGMRTRLVAAVALAASACSSRCSSSRRRLLAAVDDCVSDHDDRRRASKRRAQLDLARGRRRRPRARTYQAEAYAEPGPFPVGVASSPVGRCRSPSSIPVSTETEEGKALGLLRPQGVAAARRGREARAVPDVRRSHAYRRTSRPPTPTVVPTRSSSSATALRATGCSRRSSRRTSHHGDSSSRRSSIPIADLTAVFGDLGPLVAGLGVARLARRAAAHRMRSTSCRPPPMLTRARSRASTVETDASRRGRALRRRVRGLRRGRRRPPHRHLRRSRVAGGWLVHRVSADDGRRDRATAGQAVVAHRGQRRRDRSSRSRPGRVRHASRRRRRSQSSTA